MASLLLVSKSCERVIEDICGNPWLRACNREVGPILCRVVWLARLLEQLRRACIEANVRPLDPGRVAEFVQWDVFELAWDRVDSALVGSGLSTAVLERTRAIACGSDLNLALLECDGMDAVQVLVATTRHFRPRGIKADRDVGTEELVAMLRVAFDLDELESEEMFWRMKQWERRNPRYPLLRQWKALDPLGVVWDQRYWERDLVWMLHFLGPTGRLAALEMDLDNFGGVNESLGHAGGDEAIRLYCSLVKKILGKAGEVYRRGGDEIVAFAPECDPASAATLAEQVRAAVESEFRNWCRGRGVGSFPTVSIGLVLTDGGRSAKEVVRLMDDAQRQAEQEGKNRVMWLQ